MRVCFLGEFSNRRDEGYRNVIQNTSELIGRKAETISISTKPLKLGQVVSKVREFRPDIIHYFTAPTLSSLMVTRAAKIASGNGTKTIVSSLHPNGFRMVRNPLARSAASLIKPDLMITQNAEFDGMVKALGYKTAELPNGVDTERFRPVPPEEKLALRSKYGLDRDKKIILHVGHMMGCRGLQVFPGIMDTNPNVQVVIVGSTYFKPENELMDKLEKSSCIVWRKYFDHIEELYQLADVYAFPVETDRCLFMPLSIIEAMSCNLPVVTTNFESLGKFYDGCSGLHIAKNMDEFVHLIDNSVKDPEANTREAVVDHTWTSISDRLLQMYDQVLEGSS
jgi:glycosyltransferase involved in cell wall biosynthesis